MKISVSLPDEDVSVIDEYAESSGLRSRSAVVRYALGLLRHPDLENEYAAAWQEWESTGESSAWEAANADGLADVSR